MGRKDQNEIKQNKEPKSDKKSIPKRKWNKQDGAPKTQKEKKRRSQRKTEIKQK